MIRRKLLLIASIIGLILGGNLPAQAGLWTGACTLTLTFNFDDPLTAVPSNTHYSFGGHGDICAVTPIDGVAIPETDAWGEGDAILWSCEETVGEGDWNQGFGPDGPTPFGGGGHVISGTWGHWTIVANVGLNFVGVAEMTLAPNSLTTAAQCAQGVDSVTMVGTMVFQDP